MPRTTNAFLTFEARTKNVRELQMRLQQLEKGAKGLGFNLKLVGTAGQTANKGMDRARRGSERARRSFDRTRRSVISLRAALVGLVGFSVLAGVRTLYTNIIALDESMARVRRTTKTTVVEIDALRQSITETAVAIGVMRREVALITEIGGQLGIRGVGNLAAFTEVITGITRVTRLEPEDAAFGFARLLALTGETNDFADALRRVGDAVAYIDDNFEVVAPDVLEKTIKALPRVLQFVSNPLDALAIGTTVGVTGQQPRLFGSALQRLLENIDVSLEIGGEGAETLAQVMGRSISDAQRDFRNDELLFLAEFLDEMDKLPRNMQRAFYETMGDFGDEQRSLLAAAGRRLLGVVQDVRSNVGPGELDRQLEVRTTSFSGRQRIAIREFDAAFTEIGDVIKENAVPALEFLAESFKAATDIINAAVRGSRIGTVADFLAEGGQFPAGVDEVLRNQLGETPSGQINLRAFEEDRNQGLLYATSRLADLMQENILEGGFANTNEQRELRRTQLNNATSDAFDDFTEGMRQARQDLEGRRAVFGGEGPDTMFLQTYNQLQEDLVSDIAKANDRYVMSTDLLTGQVDEAGKQMDLLTKAITDYDPTRGPEQFLPTSETTGDEETPEERAARIRQARLRQRDRAAQAALGGAFDLPASTAGPGQQGQRAARARITRSIRDYLDNAIITSLGGPGQQGSAAVRELARRRQGGAPFGLGVDATGRTGEVEITARNAEELREMQMKAQEEHLEYIAELRAKQMESYQDVANSIAGNLGSVVKTFGDGAQDINDAFNQAINNIANEIQNKLVDELFTQPLASAGAAFISSIFSPSVPLPGPGSPAGGPIPGAAAGGTIATAGLTLVGERGPEILDLPRGASIIPLEERMGGMGLTININGVQDESSIRRAVQEELPSALPMIEASMIARSQSNTDLRQNFRR